MYEEEGQLFKNLPRPALRAGGGFFSLQNLPCALDQHIMARLSGISGGALL